MALPELPEPIFLQAIDELVKKSMRELLDAQQRLFASTTDIGTFGP